MWKSISSSGWEYLIVWEDLGSNLGLDKITFFFSKTHFGMEVRRRKNRRRQLERAENHVLIVNQ